MDIDDGNIGEGIIGTDTEVESDEEPTDEAPNVNLTEDSDTHRDSDQGTNQHAAQGWREKCMEKYEEFSKINSNRSRETSNLLDFGVIRDAFERIVKKFNEELADKLTKKIGEKLSRREFSLGCPSHHAKSRKGRQDILDAIKEVVESYGHDDDSDGHDDDSDESDNDNCFAVNDTITLRPPNRGEVVCDPTTDQAISRVHSDPYFSNDVRPFTSTRPAPNSPPRRISEIVKEPNGEEQCHVLRYYRPEEARGRA